MASDPRRLYNQLQQVARALRKLSDKRLVEAAGVTTAQAAMLAVIQAHEGCSQREVAQQLRLGESAMVAPVTRLLDAGLIERRPHPDDPRASALTLTPDGRSVIDRASEAFAEINTAIYGAIGSEGGDQLQALLVRLESVTL